MEGCTTYVFLAAMSVADAAPPSSSDLTPTPEIQLDV
ncbi:MAG: tRNA threonylcarbamoyladenosine dehydratase, partial [Burkholderia contaminans]